jgi:hypothetical protein
MNEIIDILINLLCPGSSAYECQKFVVGYDNPMLQLLWFLFFPMVFMILFTMRLGSSVAGGEKKWGTLIGMGIVILIIIQGWWHIVLMVSKIWWFSLLILGGLYIFTHKMGVKNIAGGQQTQTYTGESHWLKTALLGGQELDPRKRAANRKIIDGRIKLIKAQIVETKREWGSMSDRERATARTDLDKLNLERELLEKHKKQGTLPD